MRMNTELNSSIPRVPYLLCYQYYQIKAFNFCGHLISRLDSYKWTVAEMIYFKIECFL